MNRRTFLKGLFAAAVTPASVVRGLYSPKAIDVHWARFKGTITWDYSELFGPGIIKTRTVDTDIDGNVLFDELKERYKGIPERWKNYHFQERHVDPDTLKAEMRRLHLTTKWQPPKEKIFFKGVELEFVPNLGDRDDEVYIGLKEKRMNDGA